ncbi:MAG TPA: DUF72 domain-containing protein, partial [Streptosporangiaceae bacterium]
VKASRYLTHVRRLHDPAEPVDRLLRAASALGDRLGPVLLQLPPNLGADPDALDACLREFARFPGGVKVAVEFRHQSWWTGEVRQLLASHQAALCWADRLGRPAAPLWRTADWGYLRLHEGAAQPWPRYGEQALRSWVQRIAQAWPEPGADVFAFFNNDPDGAAVHDAAAFAAAARAAGREVTRVAEPVPAGQPG